MVATIEKNEAEVLRALRSRYERDGYTFVIHPTQDLVPDFLQGYQPDALALSNDGSIVIEVKSSRSRETDSRLSQLAERIAHHPGWQLKVHYAGNFSSPVYSKATKADIVEMIGEVVTLQEAGYLRAALVIAWAALEAIARTFRGDEDRVKPMIPSEVVEWLAQSGHIASGEARFLKDTIKKRNAAVHGHPTVEVSANEMTALLNTLDNLKSQLIDHR